MKIGVDLDDVLAHFLPALVKYHNAEYKTDLKPEQFSSYWFNEIWGGTAEESNQKVANFHKGEYAKKMKPFDGAKEAIATLAKNHELHVITSRHVDHREETERWIREHFPEAFKDIHHSDHFLVTDGSRKKSHICDELGIGVFIEDSPHWAIECSSPSRKVFLIDHPWNKHHELPEEVERVYSWAEIELLM
jgi:uncharacterized HAD superfamily protein